MFQTFTASSDPASGPDRLASLRTRLAEQDLDGVLVPRTDRWQGEYVAACDERLAWLTGFTGSAGFAAVLADVAGVFIDGRYRLQVRDQTADVFTPVNWPETKLSDWLIKHLPNGGTVAYDPWLHTVSTIEDLTGTLADSGIDLRATANQIDPIWTDRPARPGAPYFAQQLEFTGASHAQKRARLSADMNRGHWVITLPDSIAWLLNIRGADIPRNPVPQAYAILHCDGTVDLFAPAEKCADIATHLGEDVTIQDPDSFEVALTTLDGPVRIDPDVCPDAIAAILADAECDVVHGTDPCIMPKACKTPTEIAGSRTAHRRDGAAMVRFLAWLDQTAPHGHLTEIDVVQQLESFRRETGALRDISFETICGAGSHGAIVHYRVTEDTNRPVQSGELLLVDSGGQYVDGTTDITRTVIIGEPTSEHRDRYTRVLQGMIAVSKLRFPVGLSGQHLDALARAPLWAAGLDFDHGTGHGVGSYLSVHEGPQGISRRSKVTLKSGMILSNEPGYYREGAYGIRIENLIVCHDAGPLDGGDDRPMLTFETLTHVPLARRLIDTSLLSQTELDWINDYHADTLRIIGPLLEGAARDWLDIACHPL
ncbi:aminopeptidase P family protein [Loktanella sp. SALINAS62]|uniref:aminopeptidase P family protein n=1 Tax=Loktanella sp. SALINAS62 TaxID=2706124 RepID=UPI001B8B03FB|nr:aminopeptidase P family protein [Loktanella sp. SALINAS62]MBS1303803.1 aminopeptidase P family protein [Loktanella sp. SALINAS62]